MTRTGRHLMLLLAAALVWRALVLASLGGHPLAEWHRWDQSDMAVYLKQAERLAGGDWLARRPVRPEHAWMAAAAAPGRWASWYPPGVFYQAPLYSYLLAPLAWAGVEPGWPARALQALAGIAACLLMYGFTRRLFGPAAGLAAGLATAAYAPLLMIETQPLKEPLALALALAALALVAGWLRRPRGPAPLLAGVVVGVLAMLHEGTPPIALALLLAGLARGRRLGARGAAGFAALFLLGALLGFAPLLARNVAVGAPPLAISTRPAITWALANHPDALEGGLRWSNPTPRFAEMMDEVAAGRPLPLAVGSAWQGDWPRLLLNWARRALALLSPAESPDNTALPYFRLYVPMLWLSLDFAILLPLAAVGLARRRPRAWWAALRRGSPMALTLLWLALMVPALAAVFPLGRLRLFLLPALAPLAGLGAVGLLAALRRRRPVRLAVLAAALLLAVAIQRGIDRAWPLGGWRATDFSVASRIYLDWREPARALAELERGQELLGAAAPKALAVELAQARGLNLELAGDRAGAAREYRRALTLDPGFAPARERLAGLDE